MRRLISKSLDSVSGTKTTASRHGGEKYQPETAAATDNVNALSDVGYREPRMSSSLSSSPSAAAAAATEITASDGGGSVEHLLGSIRDLMENKLHSDALRRHQTHNDQQLMKQWMIAAAALDRICFISLLFLLVAGTVVFFILLVRP